MKRHGLLIVPLPRIQAAHQQEKKKKQCTVSELLSFATKTVSQPLVQEMGLEPTRIAPLVSEASLFANFNTPAYLTVVIIAYFLSKRNCIFPNVAKVVVLQHKIAVWSFGIEDFGSG